MNERERMLAILVGVGVGLVVIFFGYSTYAGAVKTRRDRIADLESKLKQEDRKITLAKVAARKVSEFEARSLPPQPAIARSAYQHWILTKAEEAGLKDQVVSPSGQRPEGNIYVQQTFTVAGKGRYEQVVKFLNEIYRVDLLHRVSRLSLKPVKDSKDLDMSLTLDAVSILTAPEAKDLTLNESKRLKLATLEEYQNSIVGRNIFAPPNRAPQLSGLGRAQGTTNRSVDIVAKATDPDVLDSVKLELLKAPDKSARLDASGKLIWTPKQKGDYEFEIAARDDNFPPRVTTEKFVVKVSDPVEVKRPDPPPVDTEPKLAFDNAKYTALTAVIGVGDQAEIWLHVRPTNELLKLHEGDVFEIGSAKGTIRTIGENEFVYESTAKATKGKLLRLTRGNLLDKAGENTTVPTSTDASESETETPKPESSKAETSKTDPPVGEANAEKPGEPKPAEQEDKPKTEPAAEPAPDTAE